MRILINLLNFRPARIGGTETYVRELAAHLPAVAGRDEIILVTGRDVAAGFECAGLSVVALDYSTAQICGMRFLETATPFRARSVERQIERLAPDVVLFPQQCMFPARVAAPSVLVVHDLFHVFHPRYLSAAQRWYRRRAYPAAIAHARHLIAISEFTRRTLHAAHPETAGRVSVVPHGIREMAGDSIEPWTGSSRPYLYYPAVSLPHKKHELLFRSVARLREEGRFPWSLVLSGHCTRHWRRLAKHVRELGLEDVVTHLGYVPYETVLRLVKGARCVVFPSEFEGFGIPVLEAAALERRVVTSQLEVFAEIGVPECCRVDFDDVDALARALADPTPLPLSCSPWTWTETAQATLDILRRVAAGKGAPHFGIRRDVDLPALRAHSAGRATTTGVEARQRRAA